MKQTIFFVALGVVSVSLQGCTFGTEQENCDGEDCSCILSFHSFWARIRISGVPIEHSSRTFTVPDAAKDVPNATEAPCCDAIFDQIDFDEGKSPTMHNKTLDSFSANCSSSPNKEIASLAAAKQQTSDSISGLIARKLQGLRKAPAPWQQATRPNVQDHDQGWQPIYDGEQGQDCEITTNGFPLNNAMISSGSMNVKLKWVDPDGNTPCCSALKPLLTQLYIKGVPESQVDPKVRAKFCSSCKNSPNQGIALAAYRCFAKDPLDVEV